MIAGWYAIEGESSEFGYWSSRPEIRVGSRPVASTNFEIISHGVAARGYIKVRLDAGEPITMEQVFDAIKKMCRARGINPDTCDFQVECGADPVAGAEIRVIFFMLRPKE